MEPITRALPKPATPHQFIELFNEIMHNAEELIEKGCSEKGPCKRKCSGPEEDLLNGASASRNQKMNSVSETRETRLLKMSANVCPQILLCSEQKTIVVVLELYLSKLIRLMLYVHIKFYLTLCV